MAFVMVIGASTMTLPEFVSPIERVPAVMLCVNWVAESSKTPGCGRLKLETISMFSGGVGEPGLKDAERGASDTV